MEFGSHFEHAIHYDSNARKKDRFIKSQAIRYEYGIYAFPIGLIVLVLLFKLRLHSVRSDMDACIHGRNETQIV